MIIVRHGEIYTKSDYVRHQMISRLSNNLRKALPGCRVVSRKWRIEVHCPKRLEKLCEQKAARVFGVASTSAVRVVRATSLLHAIKTAALLNASKSGLKKGMSFAVRTKRLTKEFPKDSMAINREVGEFIRRRTGAAVDLEHPDVQVFIEVYGGKAYVFSKQEAGPGGLPLGSAGRMLLLLEDDNTALAGWLMLKRGAKLICAFKRKEQKGQAAPLRGWAIPAPLLFFKRPEEEVIRWKKCLGVITSTRSPRKFADMCKRFEVPAYAPLIGLSDKRLRELRQKLLK
ncbi:hypothetical protein HYS54_01465 [Candidatus Micrarchaeota archaeon]|nr:hypothetical protein [Candidatus Micrarchaeota archaeon]